MPAITPDIKDVYLAVWDEKENTVTTYTGEDQDTYTDPEYRWDGAFTIPHADAVAQMVEIFVNGSIPKAIPDWSCITPMPIDNIFRPVFDLRMIEVAFKQLEEGKKLLLVKILSIHETSEFIQKSLEERKEAEIRNKILGGTPAGMGQPNGIPQGAMQISPEQLQQMINAGLIKPVNGGPMPQSPQPKPSGILLK